MRRPGEFGTLREEEKGTEGRGEEVGRTPGGFDVMSYVTRLIPAISFVMRDEMRRRTSGGKTNQSAVIKSSDWTARSAMTCSYVRRSPMTPTARTGSSTANAWLMRSYRPAARISSR